MLDTQYAKGNKSDLPLGWTLFICFNTQCIEKLLASLSLSGFRCLGPGRSDGEGD